MPPKNDLLVMLGPDSAARGGIASVLRIWQHAGLLDGRPVRVLTSYVDGGAGQKLLAFVHALAQFALLLLRGRVAAVHVHSASNASFRRKSVFLALARLAGKPYVFHLHGGAFDRYYAAIGERERAWVRRTLRGAKVIGVLSETWASWLRTNIGHGDVRVLPNPVLPVVLPAGIPREAQTLLFLGRLEEAKGVFVLIDALARLVPRYPQLVAVLAGEGDADAVRAAAGAAGVLAHIELAGWVEGAAKDRLLARAGAFVLPSRFEGLPMALLEAQAAGLPVVASGVGGIPQVIRNGVNGQLHAPDDAGSLTAALALILANPARAARMGEAGREHVLALYGVDRVRRLLDAMWDSVGLVRRAPATSTAPAAADSGRRRQGRGGR